MRTHRNNQIFNQGSSSGLKIQDPWESLPSILNLECGPRAKFQSFQSFEGPDNETPIPASTLSHPHAQRLVLETLQVDPNDE